MADMTAAEAAMFNDFAFRRVITPTLLDEGGDKVTDDPKDHGGRTKFGITQRLLNAVWPGKIVDTLTEAEAKQIYYVHFWIEYKFDTLPERIGAKMFNFCVTAGPKAAFLCLQRAMRSNTIDVKEDGVVGPITRGKLMSFLFPVGLNGAPQECAESCIMAALKSEIAGYYRDLDQERFEAGWVNRAYRG